MQYKGEKLIFKITITSIILFSIVELCCSKKIIVQHLSYYEIVQTHPKLAYALNQLSRPGNIDKDSVYLITKKYFTGKNTTLIMLPTDTAFIENTYPIGASNWHFELDISIYEWNGCNLIPIDANIKYLTFDITADTNTAIFYHAHFTSSAHGE